MRDCPISVGYNSPRLCRVVREGSIPRMQIRNSIFKSFPVASGRILNSAMDFNAWLERGQGGEMNPCG